MGKVRYQDCVVKAFEPLLRASERADLADHLRVQPPPDDERTDQFRKFGSMRDDHFPPLFLPNGGFFFPFHTDDTQCFAFSSFLDEYDLRRTLNTWLVDHDGTLEFTDQATFLFLSYHVSNYYSLRPEYQSRREADEIIALAGYEGYQGHSVSDLISYFRPTYIVSVSRDSLLSEIDPFVVAAELLSLVPNLRPPIIDEIFARQIYSSLSIPSIRAESLFLILTSTRWRYAYLELFRVIEATLYLPWMLDLKSSYPSSVSARELYASIREKLDWREVKGKSVRRIFADLGDSDRLDRLEQDCKTFSDISGAGANRRASVGERVYKIRNQLVHPEDFTDGSILAVAEGEFRNLCLYLVDVILCLYSAFDADLRGHRVTAV